MSETHNPTELMGASQDIAPLAWVIDEIRGSLSEAVSAVKAFLANKQDLDSLRNARNQVHQANGALQLLDLRGTALLTEAIEALLRRWESEPKECLPAAVRTVETAVNAMTAYLDGLLAGRPNQPIRLYPYYRDIQTLNRAARVHPADLVFADLSRRPAFHQIEARPLTADQLRVRRVLFEEGLLGFLRDAENPAARKKMRDALADLERLPQRGLARSFWWIVRGLLDALDQRQVQVDVDLKRVLARLNLQLRRLIEGGSAVAERLMTDALYYVGRAGDAVPRVAEVKRLYGLDALIPADFERATLTAVDADALRTLKEALGAAKTHWGQLVTGNGAEAAKFSQEITASVAAAQRLDAAPVARVLRAIADATAAAPAAAAMRETVGLEVASALLFADLGIDELPQVDPEYAARAQTVAQRLASVSAGQTLPDGAPWMAELARRAQDRLTMGSVIAETQTTLREIEQRLDRFFRNPAERGELLGTVPLFDQVCGVLSVLGHEEPVAALRNVQQAVKNYANPAVETRPEEFQRIAQNLGAVGFFVETLGSEVDQPRSMFHFDPTSGLFSADLSQGPSAQPLEAEPLDDWTPADAQPAPVATQRADNVEAAAAQHQKDAYSIAKRLVAAPLDNAALQLLSRLLPQLTAEADLLDQPQLKERAAQATRLVAKLREDRLVEDAQAIANLFAPQPEQKVELTAPLPDTQAAADRELLDIFVEEANEVLDGLDEQLDHLARAPADQTALTTARRGFHTLKGSSRMVGLKQFGEAAWGVEQCFNLWLAQERAATEDLLNLARAVAREMRGWIDRISVDPRTDLAVAPWVKAAQHVREGGAFDAGGSAASLPKPAGSAAPEAPTALPAAGADDTPQALADDHGAASVLGADHDLDHAPRLAAAGALDVAPGPELAANDGAPPREDVRRIGPLEISHGLYSVFLNEADESIRLLTQDIAEWRFEPLRAVNTATVRRAHSLAGIAGTVGLTPVWQIVDPLDDLMHALQRVAPDGSEPMLTEPQFDTLERVLERVRGMLHQFAAGLYPDADDTQADAVRALLADINARHAAHIDEWATHGLPPRLAIDATLPAEPPSPHAADPAQDGVDAGLEQFPPPMAEAIDANADDVAAFGLPTALAPIGASAAASADEPSMDAPTAPSIDPSIDTPVDTPVDALIDHSIDHSVDHSVEPFAATESAPASVPSQPAAVIAPDLTALPDDVDAMTETLLQRAPLSVAPRTPEALPATLEDLPEEATATREAASASRVRDELDPDLLPVFMVEAADLMPAAAANLRKLAENPNDREVARDLMRQLHTVKGSARMAGAMRLGELVHDMETRIESAMQLASVPPVIIEDLHGQYDRAMHLYDALHAPQPAPEPAVPAADEPAGAAEEAGARVIDLATARDERDGRDERADRESAAPSLGATSLTISGAAGSTAKPLLTQPAPQPATFIRVRADVLDKLVDQAGEVSIARAKLENEMSTIKGGLTDLTENIARLRAQLREVEIQAEAQIAARADKLDRESAAFDPLEYDRYTRLQELTRLLAESVEDVAMVQGNMVKGLQMADTDLTSQSRLTRELQQQLMRVRLVPFSNISERLYRVARQTAKELDKRVSLEIRGGATEIDRGVLEKMGGPFEHLVRNAIVHGLEVPQQRQAAGKRETGELTIEVRQEGGEIIVVCADDGAGLDLERIRARAIDKGLLGPQQIASDRELMEMIFMPGFSTATEVTELAGRGVGMDVVRNELASFGGRIAIASEPGRGTRFTLYLPLTLAVTQVVLATVGSRRYAIPAGMVEQVRRFRPAQVTAALMQGELEMSPVGSVVLRPLGQLLGEEVVIHQGRQAPVVLIRSGEDRLAVYADDLSSNQEVVVKGVGPQVSRLAGILGATILGNGEIVLIINPVQLIARSPEPWAPAATALPVEPTTAVEARRAQEQQAQTATGHGPARGLIMVVDDSLTVRRVTQRLLERNGYDVVLAKDGVDALRQMQDARPDVMLVDIEMPRMDGFDLTRNVRANDGTRGIPIVMITSRTADKHRSLAFEVGVNEYLGKPYQEDELLALIRRYMEERATA